MSGHTPGPWKSAWAQTTGTHNITATATPSRILAWAGDTQDARLIAAAPELLAALREALHSAALLGVDKGGVWDGARAAITKAEGGGR